MGWSKPPPTHNRYKHKKRIELVETRTILNLMLMPNVIIRRNFLYYIIFLIVIKVFYFQ